MNHKIKTRLFQTLALFPNPLDAFFYHKIQSSFEKNSLENKLKSTETTFLRLQSVLEALSIPVKNQSFLEIGSGWFPAMPYFFKYLFQSRKIITVDINQHFSNKRISELNNLFSKNYSCCIVPKVNCKLGLPEGITYLSNHNIVQQEIPQVDFVFSRYVLSHMKADDVEAFHHNCSKGLKKGTILVHFISPSDLRAHGDASLSLHDFLRYSTSEWERIHTKFDYHNRLRLPQFLSIFKECNLEVLYLDYQSTDPQSKQYKMFKAVPLHEDYSRFSDEELTAGNILVVLKVK